MSESLAHHEYVKKIYDYAKKLIRKDNTGLLKADMFACEKPSLYYGDYIPDVYYCDSKKLIIGEAKTLNDFNTEHSLKQYKAYMTECSKFTGESTVIIYVPWPLFLTAQNHFKLLKSLFSNSIKVIVLSDADMEAMV